MDSIGVDVKAFWPCITPILDVMVRSELCLKSSLRDSVDICPPPHSQLPLTSEFYAAIRQQAVCALVNLTLAALANVTDLGHAQRTVDVIFPVLLARLNTEHDSEIMYTIAEALSEQARLCYESGTDGAAVSVSPPSGSPGGPVAPAATAAAKSDATPHTTCKISLESAAALFKAVQEAMHDSIDRRLQSARLIAANPDSDADDADGLKEDLAAEDDFMVNLVDSVGYVVKQHGAAIVPIVGASIGALGAGVRGRHLTVRRFLHDDFMQALTCFPTSPTRTPSHGPYAMPRSACATTSLSLPHPSRTRFSHLCWLPFLTS